MMAALIRSMASKIRQVSLNRRLRERSFSIISNNCWGAEIYKDLNLPYQTPFVGLFLFPDCYLALCEDFQSLIRTPLTELANSRYAAADGVMESHGRRYPIGLLAGKIEIHFMHYHSFSEAREKWQRRLDRLNETRLYFKLCDRDGLTADHAQRFDLLPHGGKVFFTAKDYGTSPTNTVLCPQYETAGQVPDGVSLYKACGNTFDAVDWINTRQLHPPGLRAKIENLLS